MFPILQALLQATLIPRLPYLQKRMEPWELPLPLLPCLGCAALEPQLSVSVLTHHGNPDAADSTWMLVST